MNQISSDNDSFTLSINLCEQYANKPKKVDFGLKNGLTLNCVTSKYNEKNRSCQFLFYSIMRNFHLIDDFLAKSCKKRPKRKALYLLQTAIGEFLAKEKTNEQIAKIANMAVLWAKKNCSKQEAKFVNALLRRFPIYYEDLKQKSKNDFESFIIFTSTPRFLAVKWKKDFGEEKAREIMLFNLKPSKVYASYIDKDNFGFKPAQVDGFVELTGSDMEKASQLNKQGILYFQDPSTAIAPEMLSPKAGELILDLCSCPGGKLFQMVKILLKQRDENESDLSFKKKFSQTKIVCVDMENQRMSQLEENIANLKNKFKNIYLIEKDILSLEKSDFCEISPIEQEGIFDAIMLDAPCSNSGVLGRRVDARNRLKQSDIEICKDLQRQMLLKAMQFLKKNGRLVYSTCSIEKDENYELLCEIFDKNKIKKSSLNLPNPFNGSSCFLINK